MSSINTQALQALLGMLSGDKEFLVKIINCYLMESANMVKDIQTSVINQDADTIYKTAHKLKSSSASLGAIHLSELCLQLELKGKHSDLVGVLELVSQLNHEYEQVEIALKKITQVL
ncbi:Hpt domain-containing protein [Anabaena sp. UHCC 0204]|uniref:Hpt domain-containing protein n=1 Tax=Anabaena sp. UHCC 0204 TaxID=2590009 RepID=UPI00144797C3|nr:Hpt domain-containing protein [Anabaena sp. UHCC 0204]MTJ10563.1 Hpt domain-containing protein [Anabaena sp. UHCC 0204]